LEEKEIRTEFIIQVNEFSEPQKHVTALSDPDSRRLSDVFQGVGGNHDTDLCKTGSVCARAGQPNPRFLDAKLFNDLVLTPYREAKFKPYRPVLV
jgi:hypothetical protein